MEKTEVKLTRWGVAHNLKLTPYKKEIDYGDKVLIYHFSSKQYLEIFEKKMDKNRETINASLSKRFGFDIVNDVLCDLKLYTATEKRGFYIIDNNSKEGFEWASNIILNGQKLMKKN